MEQRKLEFKKTKVISSDRIKDGSKSVLDTAPSTTQDVKPVVQDIDIGLLKEFDLNTKYGPCVGISRAERWDRAQSLGLEPPDCVKRILIGHQDNPRYTESLWRDEKGLVP